MAFWNINLRQRYKLNREIQNEFHIEDPSSLVPAEIIADTIEQHWIPHMRWCQSTQLIYFQIRVRRVLFPDPLATFVKSVNIVGTIFGTGDYSWHAAHVFFQTELLGPKHRGAYFIGGLAPGFWSVQDEVLTPTGTTNMATNLNQIRAKWTGEESSTLFNLVIAHKDGSTPTRVSNIGFNVGMTTMRSRKFGHGI